MESGMEKRVKEQWEKFFYMKTLKIDGKKSLYQSVVYSSRQTTKKVRQYKILA